MNNPYRIFNCDVKLNITNIGKSIIEKKLNIANVPQIILEKSNYTIEIIQPPILKYGNTFISSELTITYKLKVDLSKTIYENSKWGRLVGLFASKFLKLIGKRSFAVGRQMCIQMAEGFKSKIGIIDRAIIKFIECSVYKVNKNGHNILLYQINDN